jgi:hypothetical protein
MPEPAARNVEDREMSRPHILKTITASATLLFAFSLSLSSLAGAAPQKAAPVTKVIAHRNARVSPPHAGVKLLEDILSRMRNLPQIAMSRNKQTFQYQQTQQTAAPAQGATDQLLAIRPKESSFKAKADRRRSTLAMAEPRGYESSYQRSRYDDAKNSTSVEGTLRRPQREYGKDNLASNIQTSNTYGKLRGGYSGLPSTNMGASISSPSSVPNAYQASSTKGIQNFDQATREITERLSPEARQRLTASTGKLFDVAKKMEEAQQIAQNLGRQNAPGGGGGSAGGYAANYGRSQVPADERHAPLGSFRNEKKEASKVISTNPLITEYDKGAAEANFADEEKSSLDYKPAEKAAEKSPTIARAFPAPAPAAPMSMPFSQSGDSSAATSAQKPPAEPSLFKHVREFLNRDGSNASGLRQQQEGAGLDKSKPIEIALLPPSVVTGIPLVRLGTSEQETNKALTGKGSVNKTKVNDWSVWSLQKPGNDEVSLQIYTKNGQVQAIRIFDSSLISPDFGVKLGDDLGTVKHKFGEPSFILSEPQSRGGQNYVYPISQVSFQLAYTSKTTAPKVVSLLIFNAN